MNDTNDASQYEEDLRATISRSWLQQYAVSVSVTVTGCIDFKLKDPRSSPRLFGKTIIITTHPISIVIHHITIATEKGKEGCTIRLWRTEKKFTELKSEKSLILALDELLVAIRQEIQTYIDLLSRNLFDLKQLTL